MDGIIEYFGSIDPVLAAFYATMFTWALTAAGASLVFLFKNMHRGVLDAMLGFTGGILGIVDVLRNRKPKVAIDQSDEPKQE